MRVEQIDPNPTHSNKGLICFDPWMTCKYCKAGYVVQVQTGSDFSPLGPMSMKLGWEPISGGRNSYLSQNSIIETPLQNILDMYMIQEPYA